MGKSETPGSKQENFHMAMSKQNIWSQLLNCSSPEVVKVSTSLRSKVPNASKTAILECVVCNILLSIENPSNLYCMSLKKVMQLPPKTVACFMKLCEIMYKRCVSQDVDEFLGQAIPQLIEMMHTEHNLHHFLDCRTKCGVYPPAPKANLYSSAAAVLEHFFAAIHLLFQPKSCVISFAKSVLQDNINEDILVFYCGLARKKISSSAFQILPLLLEYLWQEITTDDVTKTSPCLLTVIKCLYEAKYPHFCTLIKKRFKNFDVKQVQKAANPLGYFLCSEWGQRVVKICTNENLSHHLDDDKENHLSTQYPKGCFFSPQQTQNLDLLQPSFDRTSSSIRDDFFTSGECNQPDVFVGNPIDDANAGLKDDNTKEGLSTDEEESYMSCNVLLLSTRDQESRGDSAVSAEAEVGLCSNNDYYVIEMSHKKSYIMAKSPAEEAIFKLAELETELELSPTNMEMVMTSNVSTKLLHMALTTAQPLPQLPSDLHLNSDSFITDISVDTESLI